MKRLILLPGTLSDLADIRSYTIRTWSIARADIYLGAMGASFRKIAGGEAMGRPVEYRDLRIVRFRSHMIYFVEHEDRIEIVRILHSSMDAERHLK